MPTDFGPGTAVLSGSCVAEEALPLGEWLFEHRDGGVDVSACTHVHTALLQTLLMYRPSISGESPDPFLARWILPHVTRADAGER